MIGIYKITSPSKRIYIGQSRNIDKRWYTYKTSHFKTQYRLYSSIQKYGYENHIFEIIEQCEIEDLNIRERYWQDFYDVLSRKGLNCSLVSTKDKPRVFSKEVREKISKSQLGVKKTYLSKESLERAKKTRFKIGSTVNNKKVIDVKTGKIYGSAKELANILNKTQKYIQEAIRKQTKKYQNYKYLKDYE